MISSGKVEIERKNEVGETKQLQPRAGYKSPVANVLLAYVQEQIQVLKAQDPRVRQDEPNSVHLMRIAGHRLRSALGIYQTLIDVDLVNSLREELKWLGRALGAQRDAEVVHQRLTKMIATESFELTQEPASRRINAQLDADLRASRFTVVQAMDDERYFRLLDAFDALLVAPPLTDLAFTPAQKIIPDLIKHEWNRVRQAVRAAERTPAGTGRDAALHEVRKSTKRFRYAAETLAPVRHKRAGRLATAAENLQTILGNHQDSVLASNLLLRLSMEAHVPGGDGFIFGRLHGLEQRNAEDSEIQFFQAWKHFPSASLKM